MPVEAPAAPPERPPLATAGPLPAVFRRRLEAEWSAAMPPLLRRGRFLVFLHGVLALADPYGVLQARDGHDVLTSLARASCARLDTAEALLRATVAAGLLDRRSSERFALGFPYAPDWTAAVDVLAAHGDASPAAPQQRPRPGSTPIPPTEGPTHAH
ncbi:hypothetical protein ABZT02_44960 [Streptomyces sp. NPDC005402]|uniref:hypothetical protein n=1 Tax=Streptomyces sp. NPDC005402 TaxID=3155338 RepID=UPI0033B18A81